MKKLFFVIFSTFVMSCSESPNAIVDAVIEQHGGKNYENLSVSFDFRDKHYVIQKNKGNFRYERHQADSTGKLIDVLTNDSFIRTLNGKQVAVPDSMVKKYTNAINSVAYFFLLPAPLNDPAVNKKLTGEVNIKGKVYHQIQVTFDAEGGGQDHQDRYLYWIAKETKTMDYFAYSYETNGGGVRFREAINCKELNGIRFCDYNNYGFDNLATSLEALPQLFEQNKLPLASKIENTNISVK